MRWPWRRKPLDPELKKRIQHLQQRVEQQSALSDQAVEGSKELTDRTGETLERARTIRARNHFGEGLAAAFEPRPRLWRQLRGRKS